jgi:predicted helicase
VARKSRQFAEELGRLTHEVREEVAAVMPHVSNGASLRELHSGIRAACNPKLDEAEFADAYAQALVCGTLALELAQPELRTAAVANWLVARAGPLCREVLSDCFSIIGVIAGDSEHSELVARVSHLLRGVRVEAFSDNDPNCDAMIHFYEFFLQHHDGGRRTRRGVFYTPRPVVQFIVRNVDQLLRDEFGLRDGLADTTTWGQNFPEWKSPRIQAGHGFDERAGAFVRILDPAAGTGAFLTEVIDVIHQTLTSKWRAGDYDAETRLQLWNDYVTTHLLPRLCGMELMLPASVIAHLNIAAKLIETGYDFSGGFNGELRIDFRLTDTLASPDGTRGVMQTSCDAHTADVFTVVLGNPPFSAASSNRGRWIEDLLRGRDADGGETASYYRIDGQPLGERKLWLHDDYVKFLRYAQWQIESAGCGIVGFVINHGYLDNATFHGMRYQLLRAFPRITIVDLHGNRKKKEVAPSGGVDENVFEIEQGVSIGLFRRPLAGGRESEVAYTELWGGRDEKYAKLTEKPAKLPAVIVNAAAPNFFFIPRDDRVREEYERGIRLPDIMPVNTTAPVTARDSFVVAFDEAELLQRMSDFRDLSIPDDEIRRRYFTSGRSPKYPPGDTRGWKLAAARQRLAEDEDWRRRVRSCWYRPFDQRKIFWAPWMIDWPRDGVMRHMLAGPNIALVARRQMLPTQPCNYFWVTDTIALDGLIRSDNRGSESLFPLYLYTENDDQQRRLFAADAPRRMPNLNPAFVESAASQLGLTWLADGRGDLETSFGPEDVLHFIYAVFQSTAYRQRYADWLRIDFPRVLVPDNVRLFRSLCQIGSQLVSLHLLNTAAPPESCTFHGGEDTVVRPGFPKHVRDRVLINSDAYFQGVPADVWNFHVGGHQVCRKWLKDRRGRRILANEMESYKQMVSAVRQTLDLVNSIDRTIESCGNTLARKPKDTTV